MALKLTKHSRFGHVATFVNVSERYGGDVEVKPHDYFDLNPDGDFYMDGEMPHLTITEYLPDGNREIVARQVS